MDSLAEDLAIDSVAVVTLSSDTKATLSSFFDNHPTRAWVALDSAGATAARYKIGGYPQAVVIRPDGRIAAFANPRDLTVETIRSLINGGDPEIPYQYFRFTGTPADFSWDKTTTLDEEDPDLYAQAVVRRSYSAQTFLRWRPTPGRILGDGVSLTYLIQHAYGVSSFAFENRLPQSDTKFRVSIVASTRTHSAARTMLSDLLEDAFSLKVRYEPQMRDVVVLRRLANGDPERFSLVNPERPEMSGIAGRVGIHVNGVDFGFLIEALENFVFETVVIDETELVGSFDMDMSWQAQDQASVESALRDAGFEMIRERREVSVLIVETEDE